MAHSALIGATPWDPALLVLLAHSAGHTHRPLSSSFWGLPYRILNINHRKELLRGLWASTVWVFCGLKLRALGVRL